MSAEWMQSWVFRLLQNLLGYATVAVPGAILVHYLKDAKLLNASGLCSFFAKVAEYYLWSYILL